MRGKCENYFRFKVEKILNYDENNNDNITTQTLYFKQQSDLTKTLGIPKSTIYVMIKYGDKHNIKKWDNIFISKCREDAFQKIPVIFS